ncbi:MAG: CPBP family intramembrane metalloprotease [Paracoccaceae bacterium]|nr:CPBP family intramembrane metalloprotease [Paracoccaceae bacterium]
MLKEADQMPYGDAIQIPDDVQYSLLKILAIWAAITAPMPILAFVVAPAFAEPGTIRHGLTFWYLMIAGMIWQFIVSMIVLSQEGSLRSWATFRDRVWLAAPRDPKTGGRTWRLMWWLIPAFLFYAAIELSPLGPLLGRLILIPFPFVAELPEMNLEMLADPQFVGAWWILAVAIVACIFNYALGEELLFRGVLLPKMRDVFGRWDWAANAVLFGPYPMHVPLRIGFIVVGALAWTLPSRYFRSNWFALILHGVKGVFLLIMVFALVSGLAF